MNFARTTLFAALAALVLGGGAAGAEEEMASGIGYAKDLVARTITIGPDTFRVTGASRLLDENGNRIPLERVTTIDGRSLEVPMDQAYYAYEARGGELRMLKPAPLPR